MVPVVPLFTMTISLDVLSLFTKKKKPAGGKNKTYVVTQGGVDACGRIKIQSKVSVATRSTAHGRHGMTFSFCRRLGDMFLVLASIENQ